MAGSLHRCDSVLRSPVNSDRSDSAIYLFLVTLTLRRCRALLLGYLSVSTYDGEEKSRHPSH
eukprot:COSAG02_NODE_30755_length_546_cov_0.630872_1_plen_61_part_10